MNAPPATLTSACPACGKPRPIGESERALCPSCGQALPVAPELVRAARTFREAHANAPLQLRQTGDIEALMARGNAALARFRVAAGLFGAPLLLAFAYGIASTRQWATDAARPSVVLAPAFILPLLVLLASGVFVWRRLAARNLAVQSLLWARPMADMPGGFGCRLCGGPLPTSGASRATVTCTYCRSDNIVGSDISQRAASAALVDYGTKAHRVLDAFGADVKPWAAIASIAAPVIALGVGLLVARAVSKKLQAEQLPYDATIAYVQARCPSERSATVWKAGAVRTATCYEDGEKPIVTPYSRADLEKAVVGSCEVHWDSLLVQTSAELSMDAIGTFSDGLHRNHVKLDAGFGAKGDCLVEGLSVFVPETKTKH